MVTLREYSSRWRNGSGGTWVSQRWVKDRLGFVQRYLDAFGELPLSEAARARSVWQIQRQIIDEGFSNALVNRSTAAFVGLVRDAESDEFVDEGTHARMVAKIEWLPEIPSGKNQPFTPEERDAILASARRLYDHPRWLVFTAMLAYTGCRPSEALGLRWGQVNVPDRWIVFRESRSRQALGNCKNSRSVRTIPMAGKLAAILELVARGGDEDFVCVGVAGRPLNERFFLRKVWPRLIAEAAIPVRSMTPRCLRHTWASIAAKNGLSRNDAAKITGHTPEAMEKHYQRYLGDPLRIDVDRAIQTPLPVGSIVRRASRQKTAGTDCSGRPSSSPPVAGKLA